MWTGSILASDHSAIQGHFHPPGESRADVATLDLDANALVVSDAGGAELARASLITVAISDRVGRIPRRLSFPDGALFETQDNDAVDELLIRAGQRNPSRVHGLERVRPRLAIFVIAVLLLAVGIYRYALPVLVEVAVLVTPPAVNDLLASGTLSSLDQTLFSESSLPKPTQESITADFKRLASHAVRGENGYRLEFRDGGYIGPNAFALPDGSIVLTDQLVAMAGTDREMVLGVLAHELGHVDRKHSLRQLYRSAGSAALIMLIAGDIGSAGEDLLTGGAGLLALSHSRDAEAEADRVSVELMAKAGMDPRAIGRFFALLEKQLGQNGKTSMFSTHPGTPERRQAIDAYAREIE